MQGGIVVWKCKITLHNHHNRAWPSVYLKGPWEGAKASQFRIKLDALAPGDTDTGKMIKVLLGEQGSAPFYWKRKLYESGEAVTMKMISK